MDTYASDISMLLQKHVKNELTDQEKQRLSDWVNASEANKRVFAELTDEESLNAAFAEYSSQVKEHGAQRSGHDTMSVVRMYARRPARRIYMAVAASAAAAILVLFAARFYLNGRSHHPNEAAAATPSQLAYEIPPAANKATLTLSSGRHIILSDAANGQIAQDGKAVINKQQDGELMYDASGKHGDASLTYNTVTTPRGGKYQVVLPDGSRVWLNAATALRFPTSFAGKDRVVELAGEAYFEVAKDKTKPFKVMMMAAAGDARHRQLIEVLGTHFNAASYPDEPAVNATLLEGSIRFVADDAAMLLKPGEQALVSRGTGGVQILQPENAQNAIAWVHGQFSFFKAPMTSVMRELSRWYDVQVIYEGNGRPTTLFTGKINRMIPLATLLSHLEEMGATRFTIEGRTVKVKA